MTELNLLYFVRATEARCADPETLNCVGDSLLKYQLSSPFDPPVSLSRFHYMRLGIFSITVMVYIIISY